MCVLPINKLSSYQIMLIAFILTICVTVIHSKHIAKKHVLNSVYPYETIPPRYDITSWVKQLHLQQCAFINVGGGYFAIFVEIRPRQYDPDQYVQEFFLGYCDNETLSFWSLCSSELSKRRRKDCRLKLIQQSNKTIPRVHRRLCDITNLQRIAKACKCDNQLGEPLSKVTGFPSCFQSPLPYSICGPNNVCGLQLCYPFTINDRIHSVVCDPDCRSRQPFCEDPKPNSTQPKQILSFWTDWSNPYCTDSNCLSLYDEATCINSETKLGDIDCLGPGTSCCLDNQNNCQCHVFVEDDTLKVIRTYTTNNFEMQQYDEEDFLNSLPLADALKKTCKKHRDIRSSNESRKGDEVISFHNIPSGKPMRNVNSDDIPDDDDDDDEVKENENQQEDIQMEEDDEETKKIEAPEKSELKEIHKEVREKDIEIEKIKQSEDLDENSVTKMKYHKHIITMHFVFVLFVLR